MSEEKLQMEVGKIYFISYGGNTQLVIRYKGLDVTQYFYFDCLHYWNGYETFQKEGYCVHSGVEEIRPATKPEKFNLIRFEIEHETI